MGGPSTADTVGAFITTNLASQVPVGWPPGTTQIWQDNSSTAQVDIPPGSTVLYAELIWGAIAVNGTQDVSGFINNSIDLTSLAGTSQVAPEPATQFIVPQGPAGNTYYTFYRYRNYKVAFKKGMRYYGICRVL